MGEEKSNSDNGEKQNKKLSQQDVVSNYVKKVIGEMNEQYKNTDEGGSMEQLLSETTGTLTTNACNNYIQSLADKVTNINILRFELDRLPLDFSATAASLSNTNFGKSSKIKDAIDLVDGVNEISDDLIKVLKCKVDNMLKLAKYDCK